jgi:hypothetical protein
VKKLFALLTAAILFGAELAPVQKANIEAAVLDMVDDGKYIYIATDASKVVILDQNLSVKKEILSRKIKDFMGTLNNADIYSVDVLNGKVLYLAQAEGGYAELYLVEGDKKELVLSKDAMLYAKAAKFVDENRAVIALMSDETVLYDLKAKKILKRIKAGEYFYSAMAISPKRDFVAVGDEGGEVAIIDLKSFARAKLFKEINKDKILSVAMSQKYVVAGSRADKTFALYDIATGRAKTKKNPDFFIYVVGIAPDDSVAVYGDNEKYILKVVDTFTLEVRSLLVGHKNIVNVVRFLDPKTILTGSETGEILKWRLK